MTPSAQDTAVSGKLLLANGQPGNTVCIILQAGTDCAVTTDTNGNFVLPIPKIAGIQWALKFYAKPGVFNGEKAFTADGSGAINLGTITLNP